MCMCILEGDFYSVLFCICSLLNLLFLGESGYLFLITAPELRSELKRTFLYYWRKKFLIQNPFISFHAFTLARTWFFPPKSVVPGSSLFFPYMEEIWSIGTPGCSLIHIHSVSITWRSMVTLWIILYHQSPSLFLSLPHNPSKTFQSLRHCYLFLDLSDRPNPPDCNSTPAHPFFIKTPCSAQWLHHIYNS